MPELVLNVPLDYEQLPELWQLRSELQTRASSLTPNQVAEAASYIFLRLFVTLGYLARSTNKPGLLTCAGAKQFTGSLEPRFGDDCDPMRLLETTKLLTPTDADWYCPLFARLNPHLAGNFKPGHVVGNERSRLAAAMKNIPGEALQQGQLLGMRKPEVFKKQNGEDMNSTESQRCIVLIRTLDRCLGKQRGEYEISAGMMATSCAIVEKYPAEQLKTFYFWLVSHREDPLTPETTELLLPEFEKFFIAAQ